MKVRCRFCNAYFSTEKHEYKSAIDRLHDHVALAHEKEYEKIRAQVRESCHTAPRNIFCPPLD